MTIFKTTLKRIFVQPLNWVLVFMFPIIFFVLLNLTTSSDPGSGEETALSFGLADMDNTVLSKTLANQMKLRYNIKELGDKDITSALSEQEVPWVLRINKGFSESVLKGEPPQLDGFSLTVSDMSALGSVCAENITRSLMTLGTDDEDVLAKWAKTSEVNVDVVKLEDNWQMAATWLGMFGYIGLFTAFFIVKTLTDDKKKGMPDRIGVLPVTPRKHLWQGVLAAFVVTEITVALIFAVINLAWGIVPNPAYLFILLSLYNLFSVSLVLAIYALTKSFTASSVIIIMVSTLFAMLGGLFWPLDFVPEFMRKIAWFSPGYWLMRGIQNIKEITFDGFGMPVLFLLGFTLVAVLIGGWKRIRQLEEEN